MAMGPRFLEPLNNRWVSNDGTRYRIPGRFD